MTFSCQEHIFKVEGAWTTLQLVQTETCHAQTHHGEIGASLVRGSGIKGSCAYGELAPHDSKKRAFFIYSMVDLPQV